MIDPRRLRASLVPSLPGMREPTMTPDNSVAPVGQKISLTDLDRAAQYCTSNEVLKDRAVLGSSHARRDNP